MQSLALLSQSEQSLQIRTTLIEVIFFLEYLCRVKDAHIIFCRRHAPIKTYDNSQNLKLHYVLLLTMLFKSKWDLIYQ